MIRRLRRHVAANAVAYVALFVALGGSAAAATYVITSNSQVAPNTIDGSAAPTGANDNITDGTIAAADLAARTVTNGKLADNAVNGAKVNNDTLTGADVKESTLGPVPDESNVYRIHETFPADATSHSYTPILKPAGSDFGLSGGCFNLTGNGDFRLSADPDPGHGAASVNAGFMSSHAWPLAAANPSNVKTDGADISSTGFLFFETDQNHSGDQYVGTAVLDDNDQTLTLHLAVYTSPSVCQIQGTAVLKGGPPAETFSAARRSSAARGRRTSRSAG
jgi:hypothetical protein